jgi:glycine cleavage system transcriptional repressor
MNRHAVLTALGADRPGLVSEVTRFISERGGNLEDSRMLNLHGQFAMMMLVSGSDEVVERLRADLGALDRDSRIHAELTEADIGRSTTAAAMPYRLTASAMDHPGLVQSVARVLGSLDVNIESVDTTLQPAPITGVPLFEMEFVVSVPPGTPLTKLREALGRVCDALNIDWQLTAL